MEFILGSLLYMIHWFMGIFTFFIIAITEDVTILLIMNLFMYLTLQMNIIFCDCPLSLLEDKYLGTSKIEWENTWVPFHLSRDTRSNSSVECIFILLCVGVIKLGMILLRKSYREFMKRPIKK